MIRKNDTDKNKGGRPAKGLSEKRKYRITVKMATGEYYALKSKPDFVTQKISIL